MADRQGVEIDYCRACRGVWLDQNELDKIIDRVATGTPHTAPPPPSGPATTAPERPKRRDDDDDDDDYYRKRRDERRKRGSFLDNLFDVFD